ncbi:hypothetical protein GCM10009834_19910 [Streptomonospora arabica]
MSAANVTHCVAAGFPSHITGRTRPRPAALRRDRYGTAAHERGSPPRRSGRTAHMVRLPPPAPGGARVLPVAAGGRRSAAAPGGSPGQPFVSSDRAKNATLAGRSARRRMK